jgi:hypothetical protein
MGDGASPGKQAAEFLLMVAASVLIFAAFLRFAARMPPTRFLLGLYAFWALIYYLPTWIMLREVELTGWLRYFFAFTIVPLFMFLLVLTIAFAFGAIPRIAGVFRAVSETTYSRGGMLVAVPLCLVSAAACWLWYRLLLMLQRAAGRMGPQE